MEFEASVRIERPVEEVFDYVSDPRNFPRWNSAVQAVAVTSGEGEPGSTYVMERDLPGGRAQNDLEVVDRERPTAFTIRTTSGPTPFLYRYSFESDDAATLMELAADVELTGIAGALGPLASRIVKRGVDSNFGDLKRILEGGGAA
ncbi:MAG TPA: SRPBCC family protein [Solirubrobacterales bacterium]